MTATGTRKLPDTLKASFHGSADFWFPSGILDGGYLPGPVIRYGIRRQLAERIRLIESTSLEEAYRTKMKYIKELRGRPIAIETATANTQHYEVGTGVLQACLGPRMKYSCCLYPTGGETLGQAEIEMLDSYVDKAGLANGQQILDLGCANKQILANGNLLNAVQLVAVGAQALCILLRSFHALK